MKLFRWRILRKWRHDANEAGTDIIRNSHELRRMPFSFWLKTFGATFFSWTARYWVVNAILVAFWFRTCQLGATFSYLCTTTVMWIMMLGPRQLVVAVLRNLLFIRYLENFPSAASHSDGHFMEAHQLLPLPVYRGIYRTEMDCP